MMPGINDLAPGPDMPINYDTYLSPLEKLAYMAWVKEQSKALGRDISKDVEDYDLQGLFKKLGPVDFSRGEHGPDTWKKPNHPTFSDESIYHGVQGNLGGRWAKDQFSAGPTNMRNWSYQDLLKYLMEVEPGINLLYGGR